MVAVRVVQVVTHDIVEVAGVHDQFVATVQVVNMAGVVAAAGVFLVIGHRWCPRMLRIVVRRMPVRDGLFRQRVVRVPSIKGPDLSPPASGD